MTDHFRDTTKKHADELPIVMFDEPWAYAESVQTGIRWAICVVLVVALALSFALAAGVVKFV